MELMNEGGAKSSLEIGVRRVIVDIFYLFNYLINYLIKNIALSSFQVGYMLLISEPEAEPSAHSSTQGILADGTRISINNRVKNPANGQDQWLVNGTGPGVDGCNCRAKVDLEASFSEARSPV